MRTLAPLLLCVAVSPLFSAEPALERRAVIWTSGCTAFVCESRTLVTAKHCGERPTLDVTIDGRRVTAELTVVGQGEDGPLVYLLPEGNWPSLPLSPVLPQVGDSVYTVGYPGGNWARITGQLIGGNGVDKNYVAMRINPGLSGAPLLNAKGQVIGVATGVDRNLEVNQSVFVGWRVTQDAIRRALRKTGIERGPPEKVTLVAFVAGDFFCPPCKQFEADVASGVYRDYEVLFCRYYSRTDTWSPPELYAEFYRAAKPNLGELRVPTFWIRGTKHYKVGYSGRSGGLLPWIGGAIAQIGELLIGRPRSGFRPPTDAEKNRPEPPPSQPPPEKLIPIPDRDLNPPPVPERYRREVDGKIAGLQSRIDALRAKIEKLVADARDAIQLGKDFQNAGLIGKVARIKKLMATKDELIQEVQSVRDDVEDLKSDVTADPAAYLWGLIGILTGLVRRRLESQG